MSEENKVTIETHHNALEEFFKMEEDAFEKTQKGKSLTEHHIHSMEFLRET
jgi:hypothetical protein